MKKQIIIRTFILSLICIGLSISAIWQAGAVPIIGTNSAHATTFSLTDVKDTPEVLAYIDRVYVDPKRIEPREMLTSALNRISSNVAEIMAKCDTEACTITVDKASKMFRINTIQSIENMWETLKAIYGFIDQHYDGEVDKKDIEYITIDGILESLDPHSAMFSPAIYKEFQIGTEGNFGGIGIVIGTRDGQLTVIAPIEGTPAWEKGIKAKDRIVQIEDESTINMDLNEAVKRLRGKEGTSVAIIIERDNHPGQIQLSMKRAKIEIDSIKSSLIEENGKLFGYLKIKNFQQDTDKDFSEQLKALHAKAPNGLDGVILDLRNNPGGLLYQAIKIADHFIKDGVIVRTVGANDRFLDESQAKTTGTEPDYPMVVLVNEGSASASEIVSGALKYNHRATIVGHQTFGKGSVQTVYEMDDGSAVKLTVAEYLPAGKQSIQTIGIIPDLALDPIVVSADSMDIIENQESREADLDRHLQLSSREEESGPKVRIRYLESTQSADADERSQKEYSKKVNLDGDFGIDVAKTILLHSLTADKLTPQEPSLFELYSREDQKIVEAMKALTIDWSLGANIGKGSDLVITPSLSIKGKPITSAKAGDDLVITLTAKNTTKSPLYRVAATSETKKSFLNNREFAFGKIDAGQTVSASTTVKVPDHLASGTYATDISFYDASQSSRKPYNLLLPIVAADRPRFAYSYEFLRPAGGRIASQTPLTLNVTVKNTGTGPAKEAVVAIRNMGDKGAFIDKGRITLGELKPGESKVASLKMHLEPGFDANEFRMNLAISDLKLFENLSDILTVQVNANTISPAEKTEYHAPSITLSLTQKGWPPKLLSHLIRGTITDNESVKDYFIFVDDKKVAYQALATQTTSIPLSINVPLEKGNNTIVVAARDHHNLMSRESVVVYLP